MLTRFAGDPVNWTLFESVMLTSLLGRVQFLALPQGEDGGSVISGEASVVSKTIER